MVLKGYVLPGRARSCRKLPAHACLKSLCSDLGQCRRVQYRRRMCAPRVLGILAATWGDAAAHCRRTCASRVSAVISGAAAACRRRTCALRGRFVFISGGAAGGACVPWGSWSRRCVGGGAILVLLLLRARRAQGFGQQQRRSPVTGGSWCG